MSLDSILRPGVHCASISITEASRMLLRSASSNPWVSFQRRQLGQPHQTGTPWTSVTMTRPTATVAQVMTSSSQVQSPPSSHPRALSVCVLVLYVCVLVAHSAWWQGTGRPTKNEPLPPHAWLRFLGPRTPTERSPPLLQAYQPCPTALSQAFPFLS